MTHPPIQEGNCEACHSSHASDSVFLLKQPSMIKLCENLPRLVETYEPPHGGEGDRFTKQKRDVQCLSCHISHGTGYRYLIPFPTVTDLCTQCHKQYKR